MKAGMERLFVYGTLAPGKPNHHKLAHVEGTWTPATMKGVLVEKGWGAEMGFPAVIPDENGAPVQGYVLCSTQLIHEWSMLDEFEGNEYARQLIHVTDDSGNTLDAYVYVLKDAE